MPPIEERIRRGLFPHDDHVEIRPPRLAPDFSLLAPGLRALFVRCFEDGHADPAARPTASEWRAALVAAGAKLRKCGKNRCHRFGVHLEACPWCARAALLGGRDPFPARAEPAAGRKPRGTNRKGTLDPAPPRPQMPAKPAFARPASIVPAARKAAPAPKPGAPARVGHRPRRAVAPRVPVPAWLEPVLGPSGVQHPISWVVPAVVLAVTELPLFQLVGMLGLFAVVGGLTRPVDRVNGNTLSASALLLVVALLILALGRAVTG